ncbi:hypothetical protein [Virgibacillus salexigens]|uniref:hypothetical protein n=1 Tax=Virgibacillus salexigens TaxID=61016 RepID=UPI00190B70E2|nr:hypothetical protein [Virgibacillus salexigens]
MINMLENHFAQVVGGIYKKLCKSIVTEVSGNYMLTSDLNRDYHPFKLLSWSFIKNDIKQHSILNLANSL